MSKLITGVAIAQGMITTGLLGWVAASGALGGAAGPAAGAHPGAAAHGAAAGGHGAVDPRPPQEIWTSLLEGNARFVEGRSTERHPVERRAATADGQQPPAMVLTCSDSRLAPELLFDRDVGELFVVRVAGNVADPVGIGSLEYAADHLGSKVLVVLGHEKCGAVTAALSGAVMPTTSLQALVDELAPALQDLPGTGAAPDRVHAGVEANVRATAAELLATSPVLSGMSTQGKLLVVPAIYDLASGQIRVLPAAPATEVAGAAPEAGRPSAQ